MTQDIIYWQNTLYWLFSTIAQTYGAIVGIIGMLTIYKLQLISNSVGGIMERSERYRSAHPPIRDLDLPTAKDFYNKWPEYRKTATKRLVPEAAKNRLDIFHKQLGILFDLRDEIKNEFWVFIGIHLTIIILCVLGIFASRVLAPFSNPILCFIIIILKISIIDIISLCLTLLED